MPANGQNKNRRRQAAETERKVFDMKKNKLMRLASGLLVLTLISTCAISGTYAKYVTDGSASDTARVANFGVVINAGGLLYSNQYYAAQQNTPAPSTVTAGTGAGTATVVLNGTEGNIVAPGTQSDQGLSFGVSGTPEVAVTVAADITAEDIYLGTGTWAVMSEVNNVTAENFSDFAGNLYTESSGTYTAVDTGTAAFSASTTYYQITDSATVTSDYYPVVYTLTGSGTTAYSTGSVSVASAQAVATTLANAIAETDVSGAASTTGKYTTVYANTVATGSYNANTNLAISGPQLGNLNLNWTWAYGDGTYDDQDTILGDLIAQKNGTMTDGVVVYSNATSGAITSYTAVTVQSQSNTDYTVKVGTDVVAYLNTGFAIELTVTQID